MEEVWRWNFGGKKKRMAEANKQKKGREVKTELKGEIYIINMKCSLNHDQHDTVEPPLKT